MNDSWFLQKFEKGRISIQEMVRKENYHFQEKLSIFGDDDAARFGTTIIGLGDLDGDGQGSNVGPRPFSRFDFSLRLIFKVW